MDAEQELTGQACRACGRFKPVGGENSAFSKDSKTLSGWRTICRTCDAARRAGRELDRRTVPPEQTPTPLNPAQLSFDDLLSVVPGRLKRKRDKHYIPRETIPLPEGRYAIIYADPPWPDTENSGESVHTPYPVMSSEDLLHLPVEALAEDNAALFLWCTNGHLPLALDLIEVWGFTYVTVAFVWVKTYPSGLPVFGSGYWTHGSTEFCLMARRGRVIPQSRAVRGLIVCPREEHSKKPSEVRGLITKLMGELPRIELFARHRAEGWDSWGLEAPRVESVEVPEGLETINIADDLELMNDLELTDNEEATVG